MKKIKLILSLIAMIAFASNGFGQIAGTGHDFIADGWNTMASNKACGPCHTPHATTGTDIADAPLWSHNISTQTFTVYDNTVSPTMNASPSTTFSGLSAACLGCHDGTTNINAHKNGAASGAGDQTMGGALSGNLGVDISTSHPVGFTYDAALITADQGGAASPGLQDVTLVQAATLGAGGTIENTLLFGVGNDQVECASCHDAHSNNTPFLRIDNTNSELCLVCHLK